MWKHTNPLMMFDLLDSSLVKWFSDLMFSSSK